jgi:hypothetical protein
MRNLNSMSYRPKIIARALNPLSSIRKKLKEPQLCTSDLGTTMPSHKSKKGNAGRCEIDVCQADDANSNVGCGKDREGKAYRFSV